MGESKTYECKDCDFKFTDDYLSFYYNSDSKKTIDYMLLFSTAGIDRDSKIWGDICYSYCANCNKFVETYKILSIELDDYDEEEIIKLVKEGIFNNLDSHKEYIDKIENKEDLQLIKNGNYLRCYFTDLHSYSEHVRISDFSSEREAILFCLKEARSQFHKEIDYMREISQKSYNIIYNVECLYKNERKDHIFCPICNKKIPFSINENTPCPKCGGKLEVTNWLLID